MCQDLAMNQEKVAALQAYLTQEVDEAKLDEAKVEGHIRGILDAVKSDLGL